MRSARFFSQAQLRVASFELATRNWLAPSAQPARLGLVVLQALRQIFETGATELGERCRFAMLDAGLIEGIDAVELSAHRGRQLQHVDETTDVGLIDCIHMHGHVRPPGLGHVLLGAPIAVIEQTIEGHILEIRGRLEFRESGRHCDRGTVILDRDEGDYLVERAFAEELLLTLAVESSDGGHRRGADVDGLTLAVEHLAEADRALVVVPFADRVDAVREREHHVHGLAALAREQVVHQRMHVGRILVRIAMAAALVHVGAALQQLVDLEVAQTSHEQALIAQNAVATGQVQRSRQDGDFLLLGDLHERRLGRFGGEDHMLRRRTLPHLLPEGLQQPERQRHGFRGHATAGDDLEQGLLEIEHLDQLGSRLGIGILQEEHPGRLAARFDIEQIVLAVDQGFEQALGRKARATQGDDDQIVPLAVVLLDQRLELGGVLVGQFEEAAFAVRPHLIDVLMVLGELRDQRIDFGFGQAVGRADRLGQAVGEVEAEAHVILQILAA